VGLCPQGCERTSGSASVRARSSGTSAAAGGPVNELLEAKRQFQLWRGLARWARYVVMAIGEVGYVPLVISVPSSSSR
jgi:hypothetical protein